MSSIINVDYRSGKPIYNQIKDGYKRLIMSKALKDGEKLPSVRELAAGLAINPNTIQRAFRELEAEGFIVTQPGRGVFVIYEEAAVNKQAELLLAEIESGVLKLLDLGCGGDLILDRVKHTIESGGQSND